ncbi:MAG: glycerol-3-phosphate 1-O-acyltransferase PlsY [Bacteroidales bacterium]|nr:glycerol-3-phosphate 1-O-acyltransferase PlsY [Bacteroidales bacterium]
MMGVQVALLIITAYLIGSIPTAVWVGKIFFKLDVRDHGSKNAGATNAIRVLGWKAGLPVFLFDVFKGWIAVMLASFFMDEHLSSEHLVFLKIGLAAAVVMGHVFPMFAGFRGGKGVATLLGVGMAIYPVTVWVVLGVFVMVLLISGYVSLGSMTAAMAFPLIDIFLFKQDNIWLIGLSILVALFIPVTHRKNIKRLLKGEESKFRPTRHGNKPGRAV